MSEGRMRLDFLLKFSMADVFWKPEYQFVLQPIEVTETQMLTAKLQDANENLERIHAIIPAWVVNNDNNHSSRRDVAMQTVALKGAHSWLYLCTVAKGVIEQSGTHVETVVGWSSAAAQRSTDLVLKYWLTVWNTAVQAGDMARHFVLDQYAAADGQ
ncbi:unnamed protein product [Phytophthora fragariaefolia]|uniref:Unnamed protein product n=1 Tax=Phytophthora fragariaefolia TaxID=1490495 RepID=A0A9W6XVN6_9STRA|nr:unnamed protein product [Phytophthora fragariaefolia]